MTEPRTWQMWAGLLYGSQSEYSYFGQDKRYPEAYGAVPVRIQVTEDPEGTYLGWLENPEAWQYGDIRPCPDWPEMIQPHGVLYRCQFSYGPEEEERAGKGWTIRLSVKGNSWGKIFDGRGSK